MSLTSNQLLFRTTPELPQVLCWQQLSRNWAARDPMYLSQAAKSLIYPWVSCKYDFSGGLQLWNQLIVLHTFSFIHLLNTLIDYCACYEASIVLDPGAVCVFAVHRSDRQELATSLPVLIVSIMEKWSFFLFSLLNFFQFFYNYYVLLV